MVLVTQHFAYDLHVPGISSYPEGFSWHEHLPAYEYSPGFDAAEQARSTVCLGVVVCQQIKAACQARPDSMITHVSNDTSAVETLRNHTSTVMVEGSLSQNE